MLNQTCIEPMCCTAVEVTNLEGIHDFIAANVNQSGYYRVQYSQPLWEAAAAAAAAKDDRISQADLAGLLDDSYTLMGFSGTVNITSWLELVAYDVLLASTMSSTVK
jgi:hypothetical protein